MLVILRRNVTIGVVKKLCTYEWSFTHVVIKATKNSKKKKKKKKEKKEQRERRSAQSIRSLFIHMVICRAFENFFCPKVGHLFLQIRPAGGWGSAKLNYIFKFLKYVNLLLLISKFPDIAYLTLEASPPDVQKFAMLLLCAHQGWWKVALTDLQGKTAGVIISQLEY